ncbi:hypothetical protein OBV_p-00510 (plasmid) [Oscillibacter valericigenes Sjm18-20]|nr:hypothetical protein OBV_p-00510 [Oscillibacter valericigenes Sjm18-20]
MAEMIDIDLFDMDERIIMNKASEGVPLSSLTRERLINNLSFARNISTEQAVTDLLDGLKAKISRLSDGEWDALKLKIPFSTFYDAESNVDEVPADEEAE